MNLEEYIEKYNRGFAHENYRYGEELTLTLEELLENLKDSGYECPKIVDGGISVKIEINIDNVIERIEEDFYDHDYAGEDYEMPAKGKEFLKKCFEEYNEKYADDGYYCEVINVEVPLEMRYELEKK